MVASSGTLEKSLLKSASTLVEQWTSNKVPFARCRKVEDLEWAKFRSKSPWGKGPSASGSIAQGLAYERKFGRYLHRVASRCLARHEVRSGQWIEFEDSNGRGNAQPDHILATQEALWIFENKLTYTEEGWHQLNDLYSPLCRELWDLPQILVLVCKNLGEGGEGLVRRDSRGGELADIEEILMVRALDAHHVCPPRFFIHWLGINDG